MLLKNKVANLIPQMKAFLDVNYLPLLTGCTGLKSSWKNMFAVNNTFPVTKGTAVTLSCNAGYQLDGDNPVTCDQDTEFTYSDEPCCSK